MSRIEFVALMAMIFATTAFSIDAMLPALPEIGAELAAADPTRAPLIITFFIFGMGLGTFLAGPLSDAYGRKTLMIVASGLYILSAAVAWASNTLEVMLIARVFQGIGAAGPRVVAIAIIRDLFSGREMARVLSFVMMVFTLIPALAPAMGVLIITLAGWRAIFVAFILFSVISVLWIALRLPETLALEDRRPLRLPLMTHAVREMLTHPIVRVAILVQTLSLSILFSLLVLVQPVYADVFGKLASFPYWFGAIGLVTASASLLNAFLVGRFGMRRLVSFAFAIQILLSGVLLATHGYVAESGFAVFAVWQAYVFFQAGLTVGNLNAIAMEPMGHIAGMAASVIGAISTVLAACIASPIGLLFDGTILPLVGAVFIMANIGFLLMLYMRRVERLEVRI
jgi:DHA1 family bicyclomycin/chloramphenicol resistance-like MFS transporter